MRAIIAAVLLCGLGTGCCQTCGLRCHDNDPPRTGYSTETTPTTPSTTQPPAPAGVPVSRTPSAGAYGGTGN